VGLNFPSVTLTNFFQHTWHHLQHFYCTDVNLDQKWIAKWQQKNQTATATFSPCFVFWFVTWFHFAMSSELTKWAKFSTAGPEFMKLSMYVASIHTDGVHLSLSYFPKWQGNVGLGKKKKKLTMTLIYQIFPALWPITTALANFFCWSFPFASIQKWDRLT
jgi:hypothetical protein